MRWLTAALTLFLVSCNSGEEEGMPSDFAVTYYWRAGSMPPPYHYEYEIVLDSKNAGAITYYPDYPGKDNPVWKKKFGITQTLLRTLYEKTKAVGVFSRSWAEDPDPPIGGSYDHLRVTANGKTVKIPAFPAKPGDSKKLYAHIRELVPKEIWTDLKTRRDRYVKEHEK